MRRVVRAWVVRVIDHSGELCARPFLTANSAYDFHGLQAKGKTVVVPCTITYDDGKPARKKGALK